MDEGSARRSRRSPTRELVIAVVGLVGCDLKRLTTQAHWLEHCSCFYDTVTKSVVAGAAGNVIKHLGDGLMIAYTTDRATQAVIDAIAIQEALQEDIGAPLPVQCSVGLASGEVVGSRWCEPSPDYFGATVDRAAGLSAAAAAHAILIDTATVAGARMDRVNSRLGKVLGRSTAEYLGEMRTASLLTFDSPITYHEILWARMPFGLANGGIAQSAVAAETVERSIHDTDIVISSDDDSKDLVAVGLVIDDARLLNRLMLAAREGVADPERSGTSDADLSNLPSSRGSGPVSSSSQPAARGVVAAGRSAVHETVVMRHDLEEIVRSARCGDNLAWARLVERFDGMLRSVARSYRLSPSDVDDVVQATWVTLYERFDSVRDPAPIAAWLATTVRRQSLHVLQSRVREHLAEDVAVDDASGAPRPEDVVLDRERRLVLGRALSTLPERHRRLLTLIASETSPDYEQIGATLGMPVGSIGPTRARCMARLRNHSELREYLRQGVALDAPR